MAANQQRSKFVELKKLSLKKLKTKFRHSCENEKPSDPRLRLRLEAEYLAVLAWRYHLDGSFKKDWTYLLKVSISRYKSTLSLTCTAYLLAQQAGGALS